MIRKLLGLVESSDDEALEFDHRYNDFSKKKIPGMKKHYTSDLQESWQRENRLIVDRLKKAGNRAKAMEYYDSLLTTDKIAGEIAAMKKKGKKIIGTFCNMVPEELIYAAGAYPVRLCSGCNSAIKPGEAAFPRDSCPLIKASIGYAVADQPFFSLCDAVVIPATCDGKKKLGEVLNDYKDVWMMGLPQNKESRAAKKSWLSETRILKKRLEQLTGNIITRKKLKNSIELLEKRQKAVRRLLEIRKSPSPVILGRDALIVMQTCFFDDIRRWTRQTDILCRELENSIKLGRTVKPKNALRVLLTGSPVIAPNFKLPETIEHFDSYIAVDETCAGSQYHYDPVVVDEWTMLDMMRAVSERYFMPSVCPCFVKSEDRIDKLIEMITEFRIDAVINHTLRLCLLFDIESLKIRDVLEAKKIPFLNISTDYSKEDREQLRTRIEAFVEVVSSRKKG